MKKGNGWLDERGGFENFGDGPAVVARKPFGDVSPNTPTETLWWRPPAPSSVEQINPSIARGSCLPGTSHDAEVQLENTLVQLYCLNDHNFASG